MPLVASGQFTITDYADNISMILSSDSFIVATNSDGSNGNYSNCVCTVKVLHGFLDETSKWTITAGTPTGLTGVLSSATYTVSNVTLDTSSVDITATRSGYPSITKRLTVSKAKAGATGAKGDQGPSVTVTANRAMSFTSTDGTLDTSQTDIVFTAVTSGITSPTYAWTFAGLQTNPTASTTASQTITAAQFGTSRSATVTCTVGTYKQTLTIVRLEKSTAAAGATVGATWGSNLSSVPSNISTAGSTPTVDLRNNQIGLNASGQLYGAGAGNGTTISNAQISVDTATGVIGGIGTGAGTAVANSQVAFSARQTWEFRGSAEGWITTNASIAANADTITLTATGENPQLGLVGLNINGATYDKVRVRIRRVAGTGWRGVLFYGTSARSYSGSYKKVLLDSVASTGFVVIEFDMANLTAGGTDWKSNTITQLRFDFGNVAGDAFEIDWISVGKYGHDVDLVLSASSQIIAGTSTSGVVLDAASKSLQVMTGGNERVRLGNQPTAVNGSAYGMVVKDTNGNVVFDSRNNVGIVGNQTHDNYNLGDRTTNPDWDTNANGTGNVALGANALRADGLAKTSTRSNNVALGSGALRYTTTGGNIAVGAGALRGAVSGNTGSDNIAIGYNAMVNAVLPTYNIAIGRAVLSNVSAGSENVAIGYNAMQAGTNANYSVAVGHQALKAAQGNQNTAVGYKAGISQTSPSNNTLVGYQAGTFITTGGGNTVVGAGAGYSVVTGSGNTLIGAGADHGSATSLNNQTIIGSGAGVVLKHSGTLLETEHNISSGGNITASGEVKGSSLTVESAGPLIRLLDTDVAQSNFGVHVNNSKFYVLTDYDYDGNWDTPTPLVLDNATTTASIYGSKAWTAGNDGAESGLDADLLDGKHASDFGRLVASTVIGNASNGGYWAKLATFSTGSNQYAEGQYLLAVTTSATSGQSTAIVSMRVRTHATDANPTVDISILAKGGAGYISDDSFKLISGGWASNFELWLQKKYTYGQFNVFLISSANTGTVSESWVTSADWQATEPTGTVNNLKSAGFTYGGNKAWHAGNDGVGSGLDADLLDGYQPAITNMTSTVAVRDGSGDIHTRLIRSEYSNDPTISGALAYRVESTSGGNNYVRFCSDTAAIRTYLGVAAATHSHTMPAPGNWFNGGYMSIQSDGVMQAGKYLDWHNAGTDTASVGRTWTDANGNLTHSAGLKVKGTGGLGYAFGGAVTQLTSRDTGVTLDTPSGTITLFSTTVTAGTMNKFTLTNSCITALDVVVVGVRASNSGTFNVFVNRTTAGVCDIVVQNLVTVATAQAVHINFAIIKGANA